MNDEGNVVVDAVVNSEPAPTVSQQAPDNSGDNVVVNNNISPDVSGGETITEPIGETTSSDIGVVEPVVQSIRPQAITPMEGVILDDVQIIEMLDQHARSNIYGRQSLMEAGFDSDMYTALAYNESKYRALAVDEYNLKLARSYKEAELTGYYITPENSEMITQMNMAKYEASQPGATRTRINKANHTIKTVEDYFKNQGLSMKGVETLDKFIKDGQLAILRSKNAAAGASNVNMVRSQELANILAVENTALSGDSLESALVRFKGIMSRDDITTIFNSKVASKGPVGMALAVLENLSRKEFDKKTKLLKKKDNGIEIRSFDWEGRNYTIEQKSDGENGFYWGLSDYKDTKELDKDAAYKNRILLPVLPRDPKTLY